MKYEEEKNVKQENIIPNGENTLIIISMKEKFRTDERVSLEDNTH
jgi:hypothetical protein